VAAKRTTSKHLALDRFAFPGSDDANAEIAPSGATDRNRLIVVRSTPASAAASVWEICPDGNRTHKLHLTPVCLDFDCELIDGAVSTVTAVLSVIKNGDIAGVLDIVQDLLADRC